jgi:Mg2+/Co2+ transporter CorB
MFAACTWHDVPLRSVAPLGRHGCPLTPLIAPVAYPLAKLLDWILGADEHHTYKKAELKSFLQFHRTGEEPLRDDEINILNGVLELNTKSVEQIMTPMKVCLDRVGERTALTEPFDSIGRREPKL